jgi:hypothetical protein
LKEISNYLNVEVPISYVPVIPLFVYLREIKAYIHKNNCIQMFTALREKGFKKIKYLSTVERKKKLLYIYKIYCYSTIKE